MSGSTFQIAFASDLAGLERATEATLQFVAQHGIGPQAAYAVRLAIEEMATNTMKYGYADNAAHQILLQVTIEPRQVVLVLEDDGREFNPWIVPPPQVEQGLAGRQPGGLGIHLVRRFAQDLGYERLNGRNRVVIRINS
ncbi:MAG: ATP-binding protein [Verrucomicrobia bacterium]|nr:ATP-binding protein [Verrucomicrobiota bacterium]